MRTPFGLYLILLLLALLVARSDAFARQSKATLVTADQQAVDVYAKQFPFNRPPVESAPWVQWGMPKDDDKKGYNNRNKNNRGKRLTDKSEKEVRAAFAELAQNYGEEGALQMVQVLPICLSFNRKNFKPSLDAFSENFGEQKAKGMVRRNPGLLALTPESAATATDQTMVFSYLVGYTRPIGPLLLGSLSLALLSLPFQAATGIVVRDEIVKLFQ